MESYISATINSGYWVKDLFEKERSGSKNMSQISKTFFRLAVMPESEKSFVGNFSCFFLLQKMKVSEIYYSARRTYGC